ncbi:MAG: hypothetical protein DME34_05685 [Verrucomicrobia bacterium]|nr:MAG: hypothetical protein DME34_05685 [Verrucomicrobiota bacterium]
MSQKNTAHPVQPLTPPASDQQQSATFAAVATPTTIDQARITEVAAYTAGEHCSRSGETLALICIRLI